GRSRARRGPGGEGDAGRDRGDPQGRCPARRALRWSAPDGGCAMNLTPRPPSGLLPALALLPALLAAGEGPRGPQLPGKQSREVTLLPNGWRISPAGRHLTVGDLPLAMLESADGRHVVVSSN